MSTFKKHRATVGPEIIEAIHRHFNAGCTHAVIAGRVGLGRSTVTKLCARYGLLRGRGKGSGGGRNRWAGNLPIPQHVHPLVREFFEIMNEEQIAIFDVSERSGARRGTISAWRYERNPSLPMFQAALNSIGRELVIRKKRGE